MIRNQKILKTTAIALASFAGSTDVSAVTKVEDLRTWCTEPRAEVICQTYLRAFRAGHVYGYLVTGNERGGFCMPSEVTGAQAKAVFVQWSETNPQLRNRAMEVGVALAFEEAFPCR